MDGLGWFGGNYPEFRKLPCVWLILWYFKHFHTIRRFLKNVAAFCTIIIFLDDFGVPSLATPSYFFGCWIYVDDFGLIAFTSFGSYQFSDAMLCLVVDHPWTGITNRGNEEIRRGPCWNTGSIQHHHDLAKHWCLVERHPLRDHHGFSVSHTSSTKCHA